MFMFMRLALGLALGLHFALGTWHYLSFYFLALAPPLGTVSVGCWIRGDDEGGDDC